MKRTLLTCSMLLCFGVLPSLGQGKSINPDLHCYLGEVTTAGNTLSVLFCFTGNFNRAWAWNSFGYVAGTVQSLNGVTSVRTESPVASSSFRGKITSDEMNGTLSITWATGPSVQVQSWRAKNATPTMSATTFSNIHYVRAGAEEPTGAEVVFFRRGTSIRGFVHFLDGYWGEAAQVPLAMQNAQLQRDELRFSLQTNGEMPNYVLKLDPSKQRALLRRLDQQGPSSAVRLSRRAFQFPK